MEALAGVRENPALPDGGPDARLTELSVVIPCRDGAAVLPQQLHALGTQSWAGDAGGWEVVVADNGSTDGTAAAASGCRDLVPNLRVVDASSHPGRHHACNVGAREAHGAAIVFLDADDEAGPGYLDAMASALREHDVVAARLDHSADPEWMAGVGSAVQTDDLQEAFAFLPHAAGASLGFRKPVFDALGGFREHMTYCEDVDLSWRAQLAGHDLVFVPDAVVRYRSRPTAREMFRQHRRYGAAQTLLFREFRSAGMTRRPVTEVVDDWRAVARGAVGAPGGADARARWTRRAGRAVGRLQGSVRNGAWYP